MNIQLNPKALEKLRKAQKLSQHELSIKAGLPNNAVYRMEKKTHKVSILRAKAVAGVLGCDVSMFIHETVKAARC